MKSKFTLFAGMMFMLAFAVTSCQDDTTDQPESPILRLTPQTAIEFSAEAKESIVITVTTNQPSWDAFSSQGWCKIAKNGNKLTVTAMPNTEATAPIAAAITVSAGKATNVIIAVTQAAAVAVDTPYPTTEDDLKSAITKVWMFSESSDYVSLKFSAEQTYTLLSKKPLTKATENIYLLSGKYEISPDLHTLTLSEFGVINISTIKGGKIEMTVTPTGGVASKEEINEQKNINPPASSDKKIKKFEFFDGDEQGISISYSYTNNKLTTVDFAGEGMFLNIPIIYKDNTVSYQFEGKEAIGKEGIFRVTYTLDAAGLAQYSIIERENAVVSKVYYMYDNLRQLISYQLTSKTGKLQAFCNATWYDGNVYRTYTESAHTCDDSYSVDGDMKIYNHDHNHNGVFDPEDIRTVDKYSHTYSYSDKINKGGYMSSIVMPDIFNSTDFMDNIGQWIGVLGVSCTNLMLEHESGDGNLGYTFDGDGYPVRMDVTYVSAPADAWYVTQTFE